MSNALQFFILSAAGRVNRQQGGGIDYLREENQVLREQLGGKCPRLTEVQRRRLAMWGKWLGCKVLVGRAGIATSDTILRW